MPSLKDLRNRIASVKSTQKITKAMQMVAVSKLRRAQAAVEAARPYAERVETVLTNLAGAATERQGPKLLVGSGSTQTHLLVVCTGERGLCGAFNTAIVRLARERAATLAAEGKTVKILCVGKKGYDQLRRTHESQILELIDLRAARTITYEVIVRMTHLDDGMTLPVLRSSQVRPQFIVAPGPGVAEPERRQQVQPSAIRPAIDHTDPDEDVFCARFGVFNKDVKVTILIEDTRVQQFILRGASPAPTVFVHQPPIRELRLRVLVEILHIGVGGSRIQVEVILLDVLSMIALSSRQAEESLFEDWVAPVPERDREADKLVTVTDAGEAVLPPPVGPRSGMVMGEVVPGGSVRTVILTHRSPGTLAEVRPPALPVDPAFARFLQSFLFLRHDAFSFRIAAPFPSSCARKGLCFCNLAEYLDGALRLRERRDQLPVILKSFHRVGQEPC